MNVKDRILEYLNYKGISTTRAEVTLGWSKGALLKANSISSDRLREFILHFNDINSDWLITGSNEMLKTSSVNDKDSKSTSPYPVKPFIDSVYAVCGAPSGFSIAIKETECDGLSLPFMNEYDFSIKAKGDSMINRNNPARSIREGDIVACRLWKSRSHVRWGEVYALATSEGVVIKKLQESEKNGFIKCVSFNIEDGFNPYDLPVEEIFDWAIVTGVVSARNWN